MTSNDNFCVRSNNKTILTWFYKAFEKRSGRFKFHILEMFYVDLYFDTLSWWWKVSIKSFHLTHWNNCISETQFIRFSQFLYMKTLRTLTTLSILSRCDIVKNFVLTFYLISSEIKTSDSLFKLHITSNFIASAFFFFCILIQHYEEKIFFALFILTFCCQLMNLLGEI